jgi:hypothetical protein
MPLTWNFTTKTRRYFTVENKENTDLHIQVNNTGQLSQQKVQPN